VLVAMANVLPALDPADHALALVHGLAFVARDTRNHPPRFPVRGFDDGGEIDPSRLADWYRRFVETRSGDAAELVLTTALAGPASLESVERMMFAAATDHVFVDGGHTIDFTNKAFEALGYVGRDAAIEILPTLVQGTAAASWSEQSGTWRHPHDLKDLIERVEPRLAAALAAAPRRGEFSDVAGLAWSLLDDDPERVVGALLDALDAGAEPEKLGRALAYAAALRIARFHVQNDFGDWNTVHHAFTAAHALHVALGREPTPELMRGLVHGALRIYLDRYLNVPAARVPDDRSGDLADLDECWEIQGAVDRAGAIVAGYLRGGGDPAPLIAALGRALLREDAQFHWYQVFEAAVAEFRAWPAASEESVLILVGLARFLAAHTPTRRELSRVVDIATRLRRGEELFEAS
jgi:hypothetical protein